MLLPLLLSSISALPLTQAPGHDGARVQSPNLLVLYTDDQGYGDCRALNPESKVRTPHMDRLAREGISFTDGHSSGSVCTPSRFGLLTGCYAWRVRPGGGVLGSDADGMIEEGRTTLASLLAHKGYTTAIFGKWHLGMQIPGTKGDRDWSLPVSDGPLQKGFQSFYGIPASMNFGVLTWYQNDRALEPAKLWTRKKYPQSEIQARPRAYRMAPPYDERRQGPGDVEVAAGFIDEQVLAKITQRTVAFLEQEQRGDVPFFAYVAFTSPHLPHCTAPEFRGTSELGNYGDFLVETDHRIGQILAALDRRGLARDTLVLFTSDNGPENNYRDWQRIYEHRSNGGFRGGKRDVYEGGHRVPFLIRWPGMVKPGRTSDRTVSQTDLMATMAHIVGADLADGEAPDSISFLPTLQGQLAPSRGPLVHHCGQWNALRDGRWKLVVPPTGGEDLLELYDLEEDPGESHNLAEAHPERARSLHARLMDLKGAD